MTSFNSVYRAFSLLIVFALSVSVISCSEEDSPVTNPPDSENVLVSSTLVYSATASDIQLLAQLTGIKLSLNSFVNDVDIYKITYNTTYKENSLVASGLIALPKGASSQYPILSYQHGTILKDSEAPSSFAVQKAETVISLSFTSAGFITSIPDYLGFGSTNNMLHPYFVEEVTATSVTDMMHAAKELAEQKSVTFDGRVFLAGYSEGGYATMATHKSMETNPMEGFELVASFPGAGAFDLQDMQQTVLRMDTYDDPFYLAYVSLAYQNMYDEPSLLTDFFKEPYASRIPSLFNHENGSAEIDAQLTTNIPELVTDNLADNLLNNSSYTYLKDLFEENSLTDWKPTKRMYMYHGTSDKTIPYENSEATLAKLKANGASADIVTLTPLPGDHASAVTPYVADLLIKIFDLK